MDLEGFEPSTARLKRPVPYLAGPQVLRRRWLESNQHLLINSQGQGPSCYSGKELVGVAGFEPTLVSVPNRGP